MRISVWSSDVCSSDLATVLLCFSMTLLMGLYAKLPFAVAPGMGINAFFTFSLVLGKHIPWPIALGIVFWSGVLFLLVSLTPLRVMRSEERRVWNDCVSPFIFGW